jgi:hypothetical protein
MVQIVQVAFGDKSRELADHLELVGNYLSRNHKFTRARTLFDHSLLARKGMCHATNCSFAAALQYSRSHTLLAQHMLRLHQHAEGGVHALEALRLCIKVMHPECTRLPTAHRWTAGLLESLFTSSQHQRELSAAVPRSQAKLKNFVVRQAAENAAEAFILLSKVVLMQERGVLAVTYALNSSVCARFASGAKSHLVARAQAQLCSCTVVGLADRLQLPLPPRATPSMCAQLGLDGDRQIQHMCSMAPFAQAAPDFLEQSAHACPDKENGMHGSIQKGVTVVPRLPLDKTKSTSTAGLAVQLAGQVSPRLSGRRQSLTSRLSICSATSDVSACSDILAGADNSTDQGLQPCVSRLSKCISSLSKAQKVDPEALARALMDLAHLCDAMACSLSSFARAKSKWSVFSLRPLAY